MAILQNIKSAINKMFSSDGQFFSRYRALVKKEIVQLFRNKQLLFLLTIPPTLQICLYGVAMNPDVNHLNLGIVDYPKMKQSRDLISAMTENKVFLPKMYTESQHDLGEMVKTGKLSAGMVIPSDFKRKLDRNRPTEVQFLVDGVDAFTSGIATSYIVQIVKTYSNNMAPVTQNSPIKPQVIFLYNPGLINSWFFTLGVVGSLLTMVSVISAAIQSIQEKDTGTLEQLLMTPVSSFEILLAKIIPLLVVITGVSLFSLMLVHFVFHIPIRGSLLLFLFFSIIYISIGIGFGLMLGTIAQNRQQVILTSIFIALPMITISGALTPLESMPALFRGLSFLNPLRYYVITLRGIVLKGVGLDILWPNLIILILFAILVMAVSSYKYRSQLS